MNIIPGEPVPPGFEDEVNRVAEIQPVIEKYKGNALVGLEYTVELYEEDRREPGYFCILCDKRGDPRTIVQHWTSFNHRMKYLQRHYPTAVREFNAVKYKPNSHSIMTKIIQSLTEAIENQYGRLTLPVYNADEFRRLKTNIIKEVNDSFHFDEINGQNFVHVIDRTLWEKDVQSKNVEQTLQITIKAPKYLMNQHSTEPLPGRHDFDEISSDSDGQTTVKKKKRLEQSPAYRIIPRGRDVTEKPISMELQPESEKKLPTPKELSLQASHIAQERYKWEKYHCMLDIQLKQMAKAREDYDKNPEKHPLYPEEWKKFWNRRYKELQAEKKTDPNKYDYKPEWITFWTKRMKEIFDEDVEKKKKEIKIKLGLPEDAEEKNIDKLKEKYKVQVSRNPDAPQVSQEHNRDKKPSERHHNHSRQRGKLATDVIDISDDDSPQMMRRTRTRTRTRTHSRSHSRSLSSFSDDYDRHRQRSYSSNYGYSTMDPKRYASSSRGVNSHYRVMDSDKYPRYEHSRSPYSKPPSAREDPEPVDEGPLSVVTVLRLLTALEEHLGSLGPRVVDLLGKALALEKVKANSADDMLINDDNSVFLETVKEKLKGLIIADVIVDQQKIRAVKKAIQNIASLLHQVSIKNQNMDNASSPGTAEQSDNRFGGAMDAALSSFDIPMDRDVIASQLAAELVKQGHDDISTEELNKLIGLFIFMIKKSIEKREIDGKPMYTKDLLQQLGVNDADASTTAATTEIDKNLLDMEDISAFISEQLADVIGDKESKSELNTLESLTDSDLQTLLQNFKHLSSEEQHHLIIHLKKLETDDPERVEKLRKFVNITELADMNSSTSTEANKNISNDSPVPYSRKREYDDDSPKPSTSKNCNRPTGESEGERPRGGFVGNPNRFSLDDDDEDDDYNFEDVFKAVSNNVNRMSEDNSRHSRNGASTERSVSRGENSSTKEPIVPVSSSPSALTFKPAGLNVMLSDTQNLVANLMGSLQQSNANKFQQSKAPQPVPPVTMQKQSQQQQQQPVQQHNMNMSYYQQNLQQQQPPYNGGFNQTTNQQSGFFNSGPVAPGYNNTPNYPGYQQWGNAQQMPNMQQYGMPNFMPTQQQQQQQQQPQRQMGYNMYGRGGN